MNKVFTQTTLRLDPQLLERVQEAAIKLRISQTAWIAQALEAKLEKEGEK